MQSPARDKKPPRDNTEKRAGVLAIRYTMDNEGANDTGPSAFDQPPKAFREKNKGLKSISAMIFKRRDRETFYASHSFVQSRYIDGDYGHSGSRPLRQNVLGHDKLCEAQFLNS
jgi:hypothetical protein